MSPNGLKTSPQRVLVTNCVALNGGDAAILYGVLGRLRSAFGEDLEIVIVDDQPEDVRRRYPDLDTRRRLDSTLRSRPRFFGPVVAELQRARLLMGAWFMGRGLAGFARFWLTSDQRSALEEFHQSEAIVSTGGTYLVERYPIDGRLLELEVALVMGRPLVLFTQSLGPFTKRRHQRAVRRIASHAQLVLLRDDRSRRHLADVGVVGQHIHVVADAAFALSAPPPERSRNGVRVAVSVRDWPYVAGNGPAVNETYRRTIAKAVERLVCDHGAEVTFLSTCQGTPEYWTDDATVATAIAERLDPTVRDAVHVDRGFHSPQELLGVLGGFDLVVATRMHVAILALVAGTPVFPIAYEFKTRELFERLGLGEWVHDFDLLEDAVFSEDLTRFLHELPNLSGPLRASVEAEQGSALATTGELLVKALGSTKRAASEQADLSISALSRAAREFMRCASTAMRYFGWTVRCPVCEKSSRRFAPYRGRPHAQCVHCHSLERHRALWLWLRGRIPAGAALLHVAPEAGIAARLQELPINYVSTDLESSIAMRHDDITALPDANASFDIVICNHVLEHIVDDQAAMREICRVLRPGGFAVLQHPIDKRAKTVEDPTVVTLKDRLRVFGQEDHVRMYGWDFVDRLREAGFEDVSMPEIEHEVPRKLHSRYGLRASPTVIALR